jgi:hypothetical protein
MGRDGLAEPVRWARLSGVFRFHSSSRRTAVRDPWGRNIRLASQELIAIELDRGRPA